MIITSETASIAKFIIENAVEGTVPYYEEMRENFAVPSVFFPSPVVSSSEHTVSSYSFIYSWSVVVFATNDDLAYENAIRIAKAIRDNAMLIPVVDSDGQPTDDYIRITKCEINANDSYIEAIKSKQAEAVSASEAVAYATANILNGKSQYATGYVPGMPSDVYEKIQHNANGTDNAANAFIAGEKGPELVVGAGGSKVFTADETQSIFRNAAAALGAAQSSALPYASQERKIVIDFGGKGSIKVDGNANVDDIVAVMYEYAKPILVSLLEEEMVEEGEESHEF